MRGLIFLLIFFILSSLPTEAFLQKKDYKHAFLKNAANAEKRHNDKAAFHSYEKTMYYYKNDKEVIEAYAGFCERRKYYDKAEVLYEKLYKMTKDNKYLYKKYLCEIYQNHKSYESFAKLIQDKKLSSFQKRNLEYAIIKQFSYLGEWKKVNIACNNAEIKKNE